MIGNEVIDKLNNCEDNNFFFDKNNDANSLSLNVNLDKHKISNNANNLLLMYQQLNDLKSKHKDELNKLNKNDYKELNEYAILAIKLSPYFDKKKKLFDRIASKFNSHSHSVLQSFLMMQINKEQLDRINLNNAQVNECNDKYNLIIIKSMHNTKEFNQIRNDVLEGHKMMIANYYSLCKSYGSNYFQLISSNKKIINDCDANNEIHAASMNKKVIDEIIKDCESK